MGLRVRLPWKLRNRRSKASMSWCHCSRTYWARLWTDTCWICIELTLNGEMDTREENVTQKNVRVSATNRVNDVNNLYRHQWRYCFGKYQRGWWPSKDFDLPRNIDYKDVVLSLILRSNLLNFIDDGFGLTEIKIEGSEDCAVRTQFVLFHYLRLVSFTFLYSCVVRMSRNGL